MLPGEEVYGGVCGEVYGEVYVVVTLAWPHGQDGEDGVRLAMHCLHPSVVTDLIGCGPATRRLLHRAVMRRVRPVLRVVCMFEDLQRVHERTRRRHSHTAAHVSVCPFPPALMDACTVYQDVLGDMVGHIRSECSVGVPCVGCGADEWGYTCTPPRCSRGRVVRDAMDECTAFCWKCLRRDPAVAQAILEHYRNVFWLAAILFS